MADFMLADEKIMLACHKMRRQDKTWEEIRKHLGIEKSRHQSLIATYSKWRNKNKLSRESGEPKLLLDENEFADIVNIMAQAFKEIKVEASFKMDLPKGFMDLYKQMFEEIKLTRSAMEKIATFGERMESLDKTVRDMLESNMPLNRRRK